jgi:hypothetical protein
MSDFTGQVVDNFLLSRISDRVGSVKQSLLNEATFNLENPGTWVLMDGRSAAGSEFETLTGDSNVPDMLANGEFLRQAKAGRPIGSAETDATAVNGLQSSDTYLSMIEPRYPRSGTYTSNFSVPRTGYSTTWHTGNGSGPALSSRLLNSQTNVNLPSGDAETMPKNVAVNHFIKTDY